MDDGGSTYLRSGHIGEERGGGKDVDATQSEERDDRARVPVALLEVAAIACARLMNFVREDRTRGRGTHHECARADHKRPYPFPLRGFRVGLRFTAPKTFPGRN